MDFDNLNTRLKDNSIKSNIKIRNLVPSQVWPLAHDNLNRENQQLRQLLDWVEIGGRRVWRVGRRE